MISGPLISLPWIITILSHGLFLTTDSHWASSHHMILFLKVLFLFSLLGRNTPGREPTWVSIPNYLLTISLSHIFCYSPQGFSLSNKSRWAQPPYTSSFRLYLSFYIFNELFLISYLPVFKNDLGECEEWLCWAASVSKGNTFVKAVHQHPQLIIHCVHVLPSTPLTFCPVVLNIFFSLMLFCLMCHNLVGLQDSEYLLNMVWLEVVPEKILL